MSNRIEMKDLANKTTEANGIETGNSDPNSFCNKSKIIVGICIGFYACIVIVVIVYLNLSGSDSGNSDNGISADGNSTTDAPDLDDLNQRNNRDTYQATVAQARDIDPNSLISKYKIQIIVISVSIGVVFIIVALAFGFVYRRNLRRIRTVTINAFDSSAASKNMFDSLAPTAVVSNAYVYQDLEQRGHSETNG
ncbi:MAG: hypothetical protein MHMPM18_003658 [Marteilia pararefringens]